MSETQKPLNVEEAAAFLGLKPSYVYNLVFSRKLAAYKPGGKLLFFKVSDLEKYVFSNQVGKHSDRADSILNTTQRRKRITVKPGA
jgi:excisionase family DNA binding protein